MLRVIHRSHVLRAIGIETNACLEVQQGIDRPLQLAWPIDDRGLLTVKQPCPSIGLPTFDRPEVGPFIRRILTSEIVYLDDLAELLCRLRITGELIANEVIHEMQCDRRTQTRP